MTAHNSYPSPLVQGTVSIGEKSVLVTIPQAETFRIRQIFSNQEYAIPDLQNHNEREITVIDAGANVGLYAIYIKLLFPNSIIHCFEPAPNTLMLLEKNTAGLTDIHIHSCGLTDQDELVSLSIHPQNTGQNTIKGSDIENGETIPISVVNAGRALDDLNLTHIDILKIDTEGCEVEILKAVGRRIDEVDYVILEYHTEQDRREIDQLLKKFTVIGAKALVPGSGVMKYRNNTLRLE